MIGRVKQSQSGIAVLLREEDAEVLDLVDGDIVEVESQEGRIVITPARTYQYASVNEQLSAFEKTLPKNDAVYRELAKGPTGVGPHDSPPFDLKRW